MPSKKTQAVAAAIRRGRAQARVVVARRATQQRKRARAIAALPIRPRAPSPRKIPARTLRALAPNASAGLLIAEGDSWFDYPGHDILNFLDDEYGFDVEHVAHRGDNVEDMAYAEGQFEDFARLLEKVLRQERVPDALLLSGGGNDIAGAEFAMLLNYAGSELPTINDDVVRGIIDVRLRDAYLFLIGGLTEVSKRYLDRTIPIITHGYDYPIPDGRGFLGGWGPLPGPWLRPGFHKKGHGDPVKNRKVMKDLINSFNKMLICVSSVPEFRHVRYVNLRNILANDRTYKKDWANELHPTRRGFAAVTAEFVKAITRV